jgi:hypothetical protein
MSPDLNQVALKSDYAPAVCQQSNIAHSKGHLHLFALTNG